MKHKWMLISVSIAVPGEAVFGTMPSPARI